MKTSEIIIRQSKPSDASAVVRVKDMTWVATYPNDKAGVTLADIKAHLAKESVDSKVKRWEGYLAGNETSQTWVAEAGGEIVGFISASKSDEDKEIKALYILPAYQKQGIGSRLIKTAIIWLGEGEINLSVVAYNQPAIAAYSKFGFELADAESADPLTLPSGSVLREYKMIRNVRI